MSIDLKNAADRQLFKINVCRLCSNIRDKVLPIFDNAGSKVDMKIKECFPNLNVSRITQFAGIDFKIPPLTSFLYCFR